MTRAAIKSSNLKTVGYEPDTQTLEVEFHSGAVHRYAGVPAKHHQGLLNAKSAGAYFHAHIKGAFESASH